MRNEIFEYLRVCTFFTFSLLLCVLRSKQSDFASLHRHQLPSYELHDLRGDVRWGLDGERGLGGDLVKADQFPGGGGVCGAAAYR